MLVLLLEDLRPCREFDQVVGLEVEQVESVPRVAAQFHAKGTVATGHHPGIPQLGIAFGWNQPEIIRRHSSFVTKFSDTLNAEAIQVSFDLIDQFSEVLSSADALNPRTLLHGDLRAGNTLL
jgi:hypothetical protein